MRTELSVEAGGNPYARLCELIVGMEARGLYAAIVPGGVGIVAEDDEQLAAAFEVADGFGVSLNVGGTFHQTWVMMDKDEQAAWKAEHGVKA